MTDEEMDETRCFYTEKTCLAITFDAKAFREHPESRHDPFSEHYPYSKESIERLIKGGVSLADMEDFIKEMERKEK